MSAELAGKRRRREEREAIALRREIRSADIALAVGAASIVAVMVACTAVAAVGLFAGHLFILQALALFAVFVIAAVVASRVAGRRNLRQRLDEQCRLLNITREELRALERENR